MSLVLLTQIFKPGRCYQSPSLEAWVSDDAVHFGVFAVCVDSECAAAVTLLPVSVKLMRGFTCGAI